jgi:hypothetical protein
MRIGDLSSPIDQRILDLGFDIVDSCNLLGFTFSHNFDLGRLNEDKICDKIRKTIGFWTPFNLSIAGKVTVAKSLILPVFNYYATIINFGTGTVNRLEHMIEKFVTQGINISKEKIYGPIETGGLNLFKLSSFAATLQCSWIKRILDLQHDNWRVKMFFLNNTGILNISESDLGNCGPVLAGIMKNFIFFREAFGAVANNFMKVPIVNNKKFMYTIGGEKFVFSQEFFLGEGNVQLNIRDLTWENLTANMEIRPLQELNAGLSLNLTADAYRQLVKSFNSIQKTYYNEKDKAMSLSEFFGTIKKGSKKFRTVLQKQKNVKIKFKCPIKNYAKIVEIPDPEQTTARALNSRWQKSYYGSEIKTFLFKLYHNTLGVNGRVSHYNHEKSPACSFCTAGKNLPAEKETISHFFWHCPFTAQSINQLLNSLVNFNVDLNNFFTGTGPDGKYKEALIIIFDTIKYSLWLTKTRKRLPTHHSVSSDFFYLIDIILGYNKKVESIVTECNLLRRHRDGGR